MARRQMSAVAQSLRVGFGATMEGADQHLIFTPNRNVQLHVWQTLTSQDLTIRVQPGPAESWRSIDPLTWEFRLRPGGTFSDGTLFSAEDAAFSVRRVQAAQGPRTSNASVRNIVAGETPDAAVLTRAHA